MTRRARAGTVIDRFRHVLWIGGGTGAGKTSVATALVERHGLQSYYYDWHDARDHSERVNPIRHPAMHKWEAMSADQRWLARPADMAQAALDSSRERMEMVIEDLVARPEEQAIVAEGYGFYPELIAPLLASPRSAVWLLPTPEFREQSLKLRGWAAPVGTRDPARARANKLERDALLTEHARRAAQASALRVIEIDGSASLDQVVQSVEQHFTPILERLARSAPASDPARDESLRLRVIGSFPRFLATCTRAHAIVERVAARCGLAPYQLGLMNSAYLAAGRDHFTEQTLRDAIPGTENSRLGPGHWQPLIAAGFATAHGSGWILSAPGLAVLVEFYGEVRAEVARRIAPPALTGRVGEVLERMSLAIPLSPRASRIRAMWGEDPGTTLMRLYRAVWELSIYFRHAGPANRLWPVGPRLQMLEREISDLITLLAA